MSDMFEIPHDKDGDEIVSSELICVRCGFRWISTRPDMVRLKDIECPACKTKGYVVETGEELENLLINEDNDASSGREPTFN